MHVHTEFVHWLWTKSERIGTQTRTVPLTQEELLAMPGRPVVIRRKRVVFVTEAYAPRRPYATQTMVSRDIGFRMVKTSLDRERPLLSADVLRLQRMVNTASAAGAIAVGADDDDQAGEPEVAEVTEVCAVCVGNDNTIRTCPFCLMAWHRECSASCAIGLDIDRWVGPDAVPAPSLVTSCGYLCSLCQLRIGYGHVPDPEQPDAEADG